jgi:hypothetical protein
VHRMRHGTLISVCQNPLPPGLQLLIRGFGKEHGSRKSEEAGNRMHLLDRERTLARCQVTFTSDAREWMPFHEREIAVGDGIRSDVAFRSSHDLGLRLEGRLFLGKFGRAG